LLWMRHLILVLADVDGLSRASALPSMFGC
jgi:hypothetical protein